MPSRLDCIRVPRVLVVVAALLSAPAYADRLSLDINDDAARLSYSHPFEANKTRLDASWLHHQDRGDVLAAGFHLTGNAASQARPINAGVGARLMFVDADGTSLSGGGIAVGGFFDAKIPEYNRFGLGGHVYYAPECAGVWRRRGHSGYFGSRQLFHFARRRRVRRPAQRKERFRHRRYAHVRHWTARGLPPELLIRSIG